MSNGPPSLWNPGTRMTLITWAVVFIAVYVFFQFSDRQRAELRNDLSQTQSSVSSLSERLQQGDTAVASELSTMKSEVQRLTEQIATYERATGIQEEQLSRLHDTISEKESQRAIARANAISLSADIAAIRIQLEGLKKLPAAWRVKTASLMTGDPGRRIAASPAHFKLLRSVLAQERPTAEQIQQWDRQLAELAAPIQQVLTDERSVVALQAEHAPLLADLGQQVSAAASAFEQQQLLIDAVLEETAQTPPGERTLEEILKESQVVTAHTEAAEFLQRRERELQEEREKTEQAIIAAEREKEQELRQLQLAAIEANKQIETQKLQDAIANLQREEEQRQADLKARVARETALAKYEQALPEIREYLIPFIQDGATQPGTRRIQFESVAEIGPVSYAAIQRFGGLQDSPQGLFALHVLGAGAGNDRPQGKFPPYFGGSQVQPSQVPFFKKAQALLREHGPMMIEQGLLAP